MLNKQMTLATALGNLLIRIISPSNLTANYTKLKYLTIRDESCSIRQTECNFKQTKG